jgi:metallo-beta-lactamase class B
MMVALASVSMASVVQAATAPAPGSDAAVRAARQPRLPTQAQWDAAPAVKTHAARAKALAGNDPALQFDADIFCRPTGGASTPERQALGSPKDEFNLPAFGSPNPKIPMPGQRLFDNFYWFGDSSVGMWLATSPQGYILFDAGNTQDDITKILEPEMKKLGLDPALIKYVVIGHYHFDHTGGLEYLQRTYKPRIIMGKEDWPLYADSAKNPRRGSPQPAASHDIDAVDGMKITVGDVTATVHTMTGHTPGSLGMIVPVKWQGTEHPVLLVTAGTDFGNRREYQEGYAHIWDAGLAAKVESVMQVHPNTNMNTLARQKYVSEAYAAGRPPAKNPLLYGPERTARYIGILKACSEARIAAMGW